MTSGVYIWSKTAASNGNSDTTVNWAEGQAPGSINDSARAMMARLAEWRDDMAGGIATGGTSTAYTVTSNQVFDSLAHLHNQIIAFVPNATSTNAVGVDVTLAVDGLGAKPVRMQPNVALPTGTLISGTPYLAVYNNTDGVFYLHNTTNPYSIPLGAGIEYWGSTTPSSCFAFPTGQAISRTTYATLFALISTTYGTGDGSTTFNLPDKTGRATVMKEASATRLTSTYFGGNSTTLGATGGNEHYTLAQADLPNVTPTFTGSSGSVSVSSLGIGTGQVNPGIGTTGVFVVQGNGGAGIATGTFTPAGTISSINGNVAQTKATTVMPAIVANYIIRVI